MDTLKIVVCLVFIIGLIIWTIGLPGKRYPTIPKPSGRPPGQDDKPGIFITTENATWFVSGDEAWRYDGKWQKIDLPVDPVMGGVNVGDMYQVDYNSDKRNNKK